MKGLTRRIVTIGLSLASVAVLAGLAMALILLLKSGMSDHFWLGFMVASALATVMGVWILYTLVDTHFDDLERLRGAILVASMNKDGRMPPPRKDGEKGEVAALREAIDTFITRRLHAVTTPDEKLSAVLSTLDEGIIVTTENGQVSLVNAAARAMLGKDRVALGTSLFAALDRSSLVSAINEAKRSGGAVDWTLEDVDGHRYIAKVAEMHGGHGGAVVRLTLNDVDDRLRPHLSLVSEGEWLIDHDLSLHDSVPEVEVHDATPLLELPTFLFDCETTGLDITTDRIVSVGGLRAHGPQIFMIANVDRLVNPGVPIPPRSTAAHGITNDMVAEAPPFAEVWPHVEPLMRGAVLVGHNIGYDIAMLRRECQLAGIAWTGEDVATLDTFLLSGVLFPDMTDLNLETIAERLGVDVHGRHTALGDAIVTAEVFVRLLPLMDAAGVKTYAEAHAFQRRATHLLAKQRAMGW